MMIADNLTSKEDSSKSAYKDHAEMNWRIGLGTVRFARKTYLLLCACVVILVVVICPEIDMLIMRSTSVQEHRNFDVRHALLLPYGLRAQELEDFDAQCAGKRVYMYELPPKFNAALAERCENGLISWLDICRHFDNAGFGTKLETHTTGEEWSDWYETDAYMLEVIFHSRMRSYPCRTKDASRADAFFLPWYAGLDALPWLYDKNATVLKRGRFGTEIFEWLEENAAEWWGRYGGKDHFLVLGRTAWDFFLEDDVPGRWGTGFFSLPHARNLTGLMLERKPWSDNEQAIPYPTSFHPSSPAVLWRWIERVKKAKREYLMAYVGASRPQIDDSIRGMIGVECSDSGGTTCIFVNCLKIKCSHNPIPISEALLQSSFCLQPRGDSATRRSVFDCMIAGSIPVFFHKSTAYDQYGWHLPDDPESYSVFISEESIRRGVKVKHILMSYSPERVQQMRKNIFELIPRLVYNNYANFPSTEMRDAFELSIQGVLDRAAQYKAS